MLKYFGTISIKIQKIIILINNVNIVKSYSINYSYFEMLSILTNKKMTNANNLTYS